MTKTAIPVVAMLLSAGLAAIAQSTQSPTNDAPNPYTTETGWAKLPEGRTWGATSAVEIDRDGLPLESAHSQQLIH